MSQAEQSFIVNAFRNPVEAERAIEALKNTGLPSNDILYSGEPETATTQDHPHGVIDSLKKAFTQRDDDTAGVSSADRDAIRDDLRSLGVPPEDAQYFEQEYASGHPIVAVRIYGHQEEIALLLRSKGGYGTMTQSDRIDNTSREGRRMDKSGVIDKGYSATDRPATGIGSEPRDYGAAGTARDRDVQGRDVRDQGVRRRDVRDQDVRGRDVRDRDRNLPEDEQRKAMRLREEQLNVSKERVQTGEVGIHKEVVTEQKNINVPVTHEEVVVERRAVSGDMPADATPIGQEESLRIPVSEERVNVEKRPVVTGEVEAERRAVQENQQVSDTVKKERARIDQQGDAPIHRTPSDRFHPDEIDRDQP